MLDEYKQHLEGLDSLQVFANMRVTSEKQLPNGEAIQGRMFTCGGRCILLSKESEVGERIGVVVKPHRLCDPVKCTRERIFTCNKGKQEPINSSLLDCNQSYYNNSDN